MRVVAVLPIVVLLGSVAGCHTSSIEPVPAQDVEVIMPGSEPAEGYKTLATIKKVVSVETADSTLVFLARADAASKGADALWVREISIIQLDYPDKRKPVNQKRLLGSAIYYPDRHKK